MNYLTRKDGNYDSLLLEGRATLDINYEAHNAPVYNFNT